MCVFEQHIEEVMVMVMVIGLSSLKKKNPISGVVSKAECYSYQNGRAAYRPWTLPVTKP